MCQGTLQPYTDCTHFSTHIDTRCPNPDCLAFRSFPYAICAPGACTDCSALLVQDSHMKTLEKRINILEAALRQKSSEVNTLKSDLPAKLKLKGMEDVVAHGLLEPVMEGQKRVAERVYVVNDGVRRLIDQRVDGRLGGTMGTDEMYGVREERRGNYREWDENVRKVVREEIEKCVEGCKESIVKFLEGVV